MSHSARVLLPAIAAALSLCCCDSYDTPPLPDRLPLVVEGWIEDGGHPVVMVTRPVPLTGEIGPLDDYIERWCRVTVSDGTRSHVLTGRVNDSYTPSFVFTSARLTGRPGTAYTLTVETDTDTVGGVTVIPEPVRIDSLRVSRPGPGDSLYQVHAYAPIDRESGRKFKFFSRVFNRERRLYSSFLGTFEAMAYDPVTGFGVSRGIHATADTLTFETGYRAGDTVTVQLCALTEEGYRFWRAYENNVSMSGNMLFHSAVNCPTNLTGNARGYWEGRGTSNATVIIR